VWISSTHKVMWYYRLREAVNVTIGPHWAEIKNSARYANTVRVLMARDKTGDARCCVLSVRFICEAGRLVPSMR
jgi:hypothetical protein